MKIRIHHGYIFFIFTLSAWYLFPFKSDFWRYSITSSNFNISDISVPYGGANLHFSEKLITKSRLPFFFFLNWFFTLPRNWALKKKRIPFLILSSNKYKHAQDQKDVFHVWKELISETHLLWTYAKVYDPHTDLTPSLEVCWKN